MKKKDRIKFLNKNRDALCVISLLIIVVLLVNELTGNIKEKFHELGSPEQPCHRSAGGFARIGASDLKQDLH